ncbi:MAG: hypothetical protein NTZ55_05085 [Candidatus Roizmanbacteria bacterium]|nr:hypothetical protein [Candidatus Roizmanbacteria bacterium]
MDQPVSDLQKIYLIICNIILLLLACLGGYFVGKGAHLTTVQKTEKNLSSTTSTITSKLLVPTIKIPTPTINIVNEKWGSFSQEYVYDYTFKASYPLDNEHEPFIFNSGNSGWPISLIERFFTTNISFGDYRIGVSGIDPTTCYTNTCKDVIDSIVQEENVIIDKIPSKKITAIISHNGGLQEKQSAVLYIIPHNNKYIVLYSFYPDAGFDKFISSFKVRGNSESFEDLQNTP